MTIENELDSIERGIEQSERQLNQAEGRKQAKLDTLKNEFGITPEDVEKELKKLVSKKGKIAEDIETQFKEIQESYEW